MESRLPTIETVTGRQFELAVKRLADSLSFGIDRSPYLGSGLEFAQSRPYQPGDSFRSIDWRVTARTGPFFVKEYEASKRIDCFLLVDTSASMTIGVAKRSKYAAAVQRQAVAFAGRAGQGDRLREFLASLRTGLEQRPIANEHAVLSPAQQFTLA